MLNIGYILKKNQKLHFDKNDENSTINQACTAIHQQTKAHEVWCLPTLPVPSYNFADDHLLLSIVHRLNECSPVKWFCMHFNYWVCSALWSFSVCLYHRPAGLKEFASSWLTAMPGLCTRPGRGGRAKTAPPSLTSSPPGVPLISVKVS